MFRKLDSIDSDWAALLWAVGGTAAVVEFSAGRALASLRNGDYQMNDVSKRLIGLLSGAGIAALVAGAAIAVITVSFRFFPMFAERTTWLPWLTLIVLPLLAFVGIGARFWRTNRPLAIGLFCSAVVLGSHFALHVAMHGRS